MSRVTFRGSLLLRNNLYISIPLPKLGGIFLGRRRKSLSSFVNFSPRTEVLRRVIKNAFYLSRRKFDVFSPKKIASYSDLEQKDFHLSVRMLFGGLVKTAFNLSRKNFFFRKKVFFKSFSLFNESFLFVKFSHRTEILRRVIKNAFSLSRRKFDVFSPKKIASYSDIEQKDFRLSVKMLFGGLVKTAFNLSRKNFFFQKKSLIQVIFVV